VARGDFRLARGSSEHATIIRCQTKAGNTAIKAGEPVIQGTSGDVEYVITPGADVTTSDVFVGFAVSGDSVTAAADGVVEVMVPGANTVFRGKAKTPASLATTQILTKVVLDFTTPNYTVDESTTTNGLALITGYDAAAGTVDFMIDMTEFVNA